MLAALILGMALGTLGSVAKRHVPGAVTVLWTVATICAVIYAIRDLIGRTWPVPSRSWLVPRRWGCFGSPISDALFGASLGLGFVTVVPFIGFYLLLVMCVAYADVQRATTTMMTFALVRVFPIVFTPVTYYLTSGTYDSFVAREVNRRTTCILNSRPLLVVRAYVLFLAAGAIAQHLFS